MPPTRILPALLLLGLSAGLLALQARAEEPATSDSVLDEESRRTWMVRIARMEGASVDVEEAARAVADTARAISESGKIGDVALLSGRADQLKRKVISATLAADVLDDK